MSRFRMWYSAGASRRRLNVAALLSWFALGCGSSGSAPAATEPSEPAPSPAPAAPAQPPAQPAPAAAPVALTDKVEDPGFELALVPSGKYAVGQLGSFALSLTPRGEFHVNQDYPMAMSLTSTDAIQLPKSEFKKADAATFNEHLARFDVPFTPGKAGSHQVQAKVKFAVCTKENCMPDERTLALMLPVE